MSAVHFSASIPTYIHLNQNENVEKNHVKFQTQKRLNDRRFIVSFYTYFEVQLFLNHKSW